MVHYEWRFNNLSEASAANNADIISRVCLSIDTERRRYALSKIADACARARAMCGPARARRERVGVEGDLTGRRARVISDLRSARDVERSWSIEAPLDKCADTTTPPPLSPP